MKKPTQLEGYHTMSTNEWYTRPQYIEAARAVMGSIELDPASCAAANQIVKAERYYTKEQNGILQPWRARSLWLNPPYGRSAKMQGHHLSTIKLFVDKCLETYQRGDVEQAIILATTEVNAKWFYPLWQYPICIPDHRVNFIVPEQQKNKYSQMFGTCFVYLGQNETKFNEVFSRFGHIVQALSLPRPKPESLQLWGNGDVA
jgi:ParB family chromosome partitioning protein